MRCDHIWRSLGSYRSYAIGKIQHVAEGWRIIAINCTYRVAERAFITI